MAGVNGISVADLRPGDLVRLKKAHPCGGDLWRVNRIGADVGLRCQTCAHHIMTPRYRIERRIREVLRPDDDDDSGGGESASTSLSTSASADPAIGSAAEQSAP